MPGILGILSKNTKHENKRNLDVMISSMMHEPFYTSGSYIYEKLGLYAGWVCHKRSFADCMPIFNEKKDLLLLFSGEDFSDKETINYLKRLGHEFDSSNAGYLIHLYEEDGEHFLHRLNGWFSGILVDLRKQKVILFNDRYGINRIYYHEGEEEFFFSSEAKSLLKVKPELREINPRTLGQFFTCDCVLNNDTLFPTVFLLPAGSSWEFRNGNCIKKAHYFKPGDWEAQETLPKETFYNTLQDTLLKILPRYFRSSQPIAISLTSGLDTRIIMASHNESPPALPCYTFTGIHRDTLDCIIAREVADACNQKHQAIPLGNDFCPDFPNLAEKTIYFSDGCHDVCGTHDIYYNIIARHVAPIRMTGKFGSEVLRDHSMFKTSQLPEMLFQPDFKPQLINAQKTFSTNKIDHRLSFAVFKEIPWHEYGRLAIEMTQLIIRTPYMDNDLVKLMYQSPQSLRSSIGISLKLIRDNKQPLEKIMTDRGTAGKHNYLISIFTRLFFYSLFKSEYIYLYQMPHFLSRIDSTLSRSNLNKLLIGRYQLGQYRMWFRDELSSYVREILLDKRSLNRPYLNKKSVEKIVYGHVNGNCSYLNAINKILTAELFHRLLIEDI